MIEEWKPVPGYEDYYEVSNLGNVRSKARRIWKSDPNMKAGGCWQTRRAGVDVTYPDGGIKKAEEGYKVAHLTQYGKTKNWAVHRLVWETFKGSIPKGHHVDHKDNDPSNNKLDNLQCLSPPDHKRVTLERQHGVKILDEYWQHPDLGGRGVAVHLSKAYWDGYKAARLEVGMETFS